MDYRQEVLTPFFRHIQSAESFYLVGAASMGKTRLLDFLLRADVQKHYLVDQAEHTWLIRVDLNRLAIKQQDWAFYELLLSSILLDLSNHGNTNDLGVEIASLDSQVIKSQDLLLALRFFELAVNKLCHVHEKKLTFLFDEFDEAYKTFPREIFSQLRAVRDANKNLLSYAIFLRNLPERLRPPVDNESFYELLSRNMLGIGPYTRSDAMRIIQQQEIRRNYPLSQEHRDKMYEASGGHPGLIQAILSILIDNAQAAQRINSVDWLDWFSGQEAVLEECRKIWEGLSGEEKEGLALFAHRESKGIPQLTGKILLAKGLLQGTGSGVKFFSYLFEQYIKRTRTNPGS
jgi:hypothetical protein